MCEVLVYIYYVLNVLTDTVIMLLYLHTCALLIMHTAFRSSACVCIVTRLQVWSVPYGWAHIASCASKLEAASLQYVLPKVADK